MSFRLHHKLIAALFVIALVAAGTGCGQKGKLYLPDSHSGYSSGH